MVEIAGEEDHQIDVLLVLDRINQVRHLILSPLFHCLTGLLGVTFFPIGHLAKSSIHTLFKRNK